MRKLRVLAAIVSAAASLGISGPCAPTAAPSAAVSFPDPVISVGLIGTGVGAATRGAPVLVEVLAVHPGWPSGALTGIPLSGSPSWASRVQLEITSTGGPPGSWPVVLFAASPANVTLDGTSFGELKGYLSPADSAGIPVGTYSVQAVLDASGSSIGSYQGVARSAPVRVIVSDQVGQPTPAEDEALSVLDARYQLLRGDTALARTGLEALLVRAPDSLPALKMLADLEAAAGNRAEALALLNHAIGAAYASAPPFEEGLSDPPELVLELRHALINASLRAASGDPRPAIAARISAKAPGVLPDVIEVDVTFTNTGVATALDARLNAVKTRVLQGVGSVTLDSSLGPALPVELGALAPGASATVRFSLRVDPGVVRFALTEEGATGANFGTFGFALTQATYK